MTKQEITNLLQRDNCTEAEIITLRDWSMEGTNMGELARMPLFGAWLSAHAVQIAQITQRKGWLRQTPEKGVE